MTQTTEELREAGRAASARSAWAEAYERLREADAESGLDPVDLERFGEAAWWIGKLDDCIAARERAFAGHVDAGDPRRAASVALALAKDYYAKGSSSIGTAWVNRAERLLADEPDSIERGWLHRLRSVIALEGAGDYETALEEARRASAIAVRFRDRDLAAVALHDEGRTLVMRGDVDEGMALMDEATAPAISGELAPYNTAVVYCNTITACKELADFRRGGEWSDAAKRWCERQSIAGFPGMCRVYRASFMQMRGAWDEAEAEARQACEELPMFNVAYAAAAFYELGEIRLRAGDLDAAEKAFEEAHRLGHDPQPGLALLRLAQGRIDGACSCIERALDEETAELHRARLLPTQVDVALARGETEQARAAAAELAGIAQKYGTEALSARSAHAQGRVALVEGDARTAAKHARQAVRLWQAIDAPYEAAQSRVLLADAYAGLADEENAARELAAAADAFGRLGAVLDARTVRAALDRVATRAARPGDGRATRTFVFTDIVRSTNLVEVIGDEAWTDLVRWHDRTLRSLFAAHGGEEVDHAGDGFFVAFPDPETALACAVEIQRTLAAHRREHGFAPRVRIGVHASEAERDGANYKGRGVHEAARISALAGGDEIVASRATADAVPELAVSEPRSVTLKGIEGAVDVVSLDWR